jgi:hypothetical protein
VFVVHWLRRGVHSGPRKSRVYGAQHRSLICRCQLRRRSLF